MDSRKTAWDRLMTYRFEDADSDRLSIETIDALTYARDMLATQQARNDALEETIRQLYVMAAACPSDALAGDFDFCTPLEQAEALLQETTK